MNGAKMQAELNARQQTAVKAAFDDAKTGTSVMHTLKWVPHHGPIVSEDATGAWGATSTARCSLPQSKMRAILVIVANVFGEQTFEMLLIHCNNVIQEISSTAFDPTLRRAV
jgi:hypothetical protein